MALSLHHQSRVMMPRKWSQDLRDQLSESDRILPGGYIYLSDLLSTPAILKNIGRIIAKSFMDQKLMLL